MPTTEHTGSTRTNGDPLLGPIQLVVIGFPPDAEFRGNIVRALSAVRGAGLLRVIDALFVRKDELGRITAQIHESDLSVPDRQILGAAIGGLFGLAIGGDEVSAAQGAAEAADNIAHDAFGFGVANLQEIAQSIPPRSAALLLLIEHRWALDLKAAVRQSGGVPLVQGYLTPEALFMIGAELRLIAEAEQTIQVARTVEAAAVLEALAVIAASEEMRQAAVAETVQVLIAAKHIEEAAAQDVVDTLIDAELLKDPGNDLSSNGTSDESKSEEVATGASSA